MADIHSENVIAEPQDLEDMRIRMYAFIFPNKPVTQDEKDAFEAAVKYQVIHEKTELEQMNEIQIPENLGNDVQSFKVGNFSMSFKDGKTAPALTKSNICQYAYSVLLREGLLYKGVGRPF